LQKVVSVRRRKVLRIFFVELFASALRDNFCASGRCALWRDLIHWLHRLAPRRFWFDSTRLHAAPVKRLLCCYSLVHIPQITLPFIHVGIGVVNPSNQL
jgi:hypothetical protein